MVGGKGGGGWFDACHALEILLGIVFVLCHNVRGEEYCGGLSKKT